MDELRVMAIPEARDRKKTTTTMLMINSEITERLSHYTVTRRVAQQKSIDKIQANARETEGTKK